ncbi:MAG: mechanosensitive ion channel [Acetobacteraceae bacterium]|nr:mechanosensitive ion channel [Acetobacteraceae bacterium]
MSGHVSMRLGWPIALALLATAAWLLASVGHTDPLLGLPDAQTALDAVTEIAGGIAAVLLLGRLVLGVAGTQTTGFHRAIIHLLLTFVVSFLVMRHFGFDLRAILATSAILTAAVGFAMQPTLGTMIAGFTLHLDGIVKPGDGIMYDGELVRVVSMNWRSVTARRKDNTLVIFPNSQVSDRVTEVFRNGASLRVTSTFYAPLNVPPQRVSALVTDAVSDFALVDTTRPVAVGPLGFELTQAAIRYRLRYSILDPFEKGDVEMELLRRLWYVFQRNEILLPVSRLFGDPRGLSVPTMDRPMLAGWTQAALAAGGALQLGADAAAAMEALGREGRLLLYAPDERLVLPDGMDAWRFLLVHGRAVDSHEYGLDEADPRRPTLPAWSLGPDASVRRVAERLARHIGPYAEIAVRRAARATSDLSALCHAVAKEIDDPKERTRFLAEVAPGDDAAHGPGLVFRARRNAAGALICHLALRAQGEVAVIAIPPGLLDAARRAAE